jgi:hypothetical protein
MKTQLSEVADAGYRSFIEITDVDMPPGYKFLKVTSTFAKAKNPEAEQTRFTMLLSPEALATFKAALNNA